MTEQQMIEIKKYIDNIIDMLYPYSFWECGCGNTMKVSNSHQGYIVCNKCGFGYPRYDDKPQKKGCLKSLSFKQYNEKIKK